MYDCEECCPGAIAPVKATEAMTQPVGQRHGQLYTEPANATIEQTTGQSTTTVMSQKAVTDAVEGRVPSSSDDSISISSEGDISLAAVVDVGIVADQIGIHATDDVYIEGNNVYVNGEAYRKGHQLVQSTGNSTTAVMSQKAVTDIVESVQSVVKTTYNLVTTQPTYSATVQSVCIDLGEDTVFPNGVCVSFKTTGLKIKGLSQGFINLKKSGGTNQYATWAMCCSEGGSRIQDVIDSDLNVPDGIYYTKNANAYNQSVTFRYLYIVYTSARIDAGTVTDVMLTEGTTLKPFVPHTSAIDYVARSILDRSDLGYPEYWQSALSEAVDKIETIKINLHKGDRYVYITDQHWSSNAQQSSELIDYLSRKCEIPMIVSGGDIITTHASSITGAFNEITTYYESFKHDGYTHIFSMSGNHDANTNNNPTASTYLSKDQEYNAIVKRQEVWMNTEGTIDGYYYDNTSQKIRYISFRNTGDSSYDSNIASWLTRTITSTAAGWTIVLLSHAYWQSTSPSTVSTQYANVILAAMDNASATVALWQVGHCHNDRSTTLTSTGGKTLLIVSTNTDSLNQSPPYTMIRGTDTEQSFDVVTIDTTNKSIYMTRIGAGSDRTFNY